MVEDIRGSLLCFEVAVMIDMNLIQTSRVVIKHESVVLVGLSLEKRECLSGPKPPNVIGLRVRCTATKLPPQILRHE